MPRMKEDEYDIANWKTEQLKIVLLPHANYTPAFKLAAATELALREELSDEFKALYLSDEDISEKQVEEKKASKLRREKIRKFEPTIKSVQKFGSNPIYKETFQTNLRKKYFNRIAEQVVEDLKWELVYNQDNLVQAKRPNDWDQFTEKISISIQPNGAIKVESESIRANLWDMGANSVRVKLFIYAFKEMVAGFSPEDQKDLDVEIEASENYWDNYQLPESLPSPEGLKPPDMNIPVLAGLLVGLVLGIIIGQLQSKGFYIIGLFEVGVGLALGAAIGWGAKGGQFVDYGKLTKILIAGIIVFFLTLQIGLYIIVSAQVNHPDFGFMQYLEWRFETGLTVKDLNTGWIGLVISWVLQLVLPYLLAQGTMAQAVLKFQLSRVPEEVTNFTFYHFNKDYSEDQVRQELAKYGWDQPYQQDAAIDSVGAIFEAIELNRA
jgi:hypothetical protein